MKFLKQKVGLLNWRDYEIKGNTLIFYNDKSDILIKQVRMGIREKKYDFRKLTVFLQKIGIRFIIKENRDEFNRKIRIIYKNKERYNYLKIQKNLEQLDYQKIENFINETEESEVKDNYKLHLEKAYAMYYIGDYYAAYKEYKKISEKALRNKEFATYALSEFNRFYVGRFVKYHYNYGERVSDRVGNEIEKIDLDKILIKNPLKTEELEILKSIFTFSFVDSKIHEMVNLKQKIDKDENTCYTWIDKNSIGIYKLQNQTKTFWNFIKYNLLVIDRYSDVRIAFYNYIDSMIKNYTIPKIYIDEEESFLGESSENIKIETFTLFDMLVILEYIDIKDLENIFNRNEINELKIQESDIENFIKIIKNCINYMRKKRRNISININKIFLLLSVIKLNKQQYFDINNSIIEYIKENNLWINEYKYLNKYIYWQYERFNNYEFNTLVNILSNILEIIKTNNDISNEQINIIHNISVYISKENKNYKLQLKNIIDEIMKIERNEKYNILINLYNLFDSKEKRKLNKIIKKILNEKEYNSLHSEIYYKSLIRGIIRPNIEYENKFYELMLKNKNDTGSLKSFPNSLNSQLIWTSNLILSKYILEKEKFEIFLGISADYDFLYDIDNYPVDKFEIKWLYNYGEKLLTRIAERQDLRIKIKSYIEKMILEEDKIDVKLLRMYVKYFK